MATPNSSLLLSFSRMSRFFLKNPFGKAHLYDAVSEEEDLHSSSEPVSFSTNKNLPERRVLKACVLTYMTIVLVIELILVMFIASSAPTSNSVVTQDLLKQNSVANTSGQASCGNSSNAALARGCKFDYLTISWETQECYHADIVDSFFLVQDWKYYNDSFGTPISPESSITDGHQRWNVKWNFHFTHCIYTWKMMQKAVFERRPMPDNLLDLEHTRHCMDTILEKRFAWDDMHTMVHVKWPRCASYLDWDKAKWTENLVLPNQRNP